MTESAWSHLGIIAVVLTPIVAIWWDLRKQATGNGDRLTRIETMLDPLWKWWNSSGNGSEWNGQERRKRFTREKP